MPFLANHAEPLDGQLGTLIDTLIRLQTDLGPTALVLTEVGLNGGRDVFLGSRAISIRVDGHTITISGDDTR